MACRVYGNISSVFSGAKTDVQITIALKDKNEYSNSTTGIYRILLPESQTVTSDSNGDWEINILDNENMVRPSYYTFTFVSGDDTIVWKKYVPDEAEAEFTSLASRG